MFLQGRKVTHKNKYYNDGVKFHKRTDGGFDYFSKTYNRWVPSIFTPECKLIEI